WVVLEEAPRVVAALSEDMKPGHLPYGFPWELVVCTALGFFAVLSLFWRGFQSVRSRLYVGREKRLALNLAGLIEAKCGLLEKVSLVEKEHEGLESSLKDCRFEKGSREAQQLEATDEKLHRSESSHGVEMLFLEEELKEQKAQQGQQDETMAHLSRRIQSLQGESESLRSQIAEAKTNWRLFQVNEEELKLAIKEVLNEGSLLPPTQRPTIQGEAEAQREQGGVQYKAKIILEDSKVTGEQVLRDTENHMESLSECLLKMKDRSSPSLGAQRDGGHLELGKTSEPEMGAHFEDESKGALRNLVYGDKLKASLEILEGGRNQKCTFSSEVEKTTEDLTEHLKSLQTEQASLQSENAQLQSENETLQENFKVMMERYQENMMKLHRKLRVEENYRVEQEEKLSKVEEKMSHTIKELETYRKRAQYLEEQLQSTIRSCLGKIISSEKEADASELAARIAERNLSYFRKQNARNRQKLTEKELRFELVEKDPYDALDVSNSAMGRKPSPNGPSPIGHPSSERRPPHFEKSGPLTLSPFTPVGGGRGSRGPGNPLDHATSSKGRESSCHKFTDFQRAPSQAGPLSPPGEQDSRLMIPPPGQPYSSDARLPLQRQDRFYSNCARASGPAEHRIPNMPPLDSDWAVLEEAPRVVAALSEDMKPGHLPYGFPWELVVCTALGFFAVLSHFWRGFQSVRSRLYVGREKRLALNLAGLIEAKCGLLEKVSLVEKEHEGLESSLKDCRFEKGSREAQQLEATDEKLHRSESSHGVEMLFLEEELKAQKAQQGQQDETMAHLSRRIQSLQGESESLRSQIAEAKTNWRLFQVNEEELKLDESKGALRNLVYGDKLKASLEILEGGRNQKCTFSSEVEKTTEDLTEHLKSLQTEQASLQSENAQLQSENETPHKNFKVMMERYQENMMKLHRKLRVEENYRVEQEEKHSKVEEKMSHTIKELETYRKRAQYLEEQLQSTIRSCLGKIISSEKEADASELAARIAERNLSYFRKQNARNRQKLTEKELRFELVEKDPYDALDWVVLEEAPRVVAALSEDMKPGHLPYGFPWELVVCTALGFFAVLSLFWRGFQSVRSRLYVGREKRLALNLAGLIEAKCGLLEKVSLVEKEHEGLESSLKDCRFEKGSREAQQLEATDEKLHRSESSHGVEMLFLEEELKAQKAQQGQQDETMAHLSRRIQSLQGESESLRSQIAEAKTNWRLFQVNEEELKLAIKEDESKGALRNLVYGDKLKASLEILEGGRNQKCTFSSEVEKTTEDLTEHLKSLQTEQASLQSENAQLQSENETLQENFKVMMERYQENMMKLHRKLRVEENYRVEQEEKLSKVEEKMSHTIKELETYRKRAQYLEEQLQSTIRSCLGKIISSEKEADASELAARIAERNLSYFRKQNARNRQKLTEKELRFELVEKDPYDALDVSNSAMGRGSRGPGNPLDHATSSKGRESSCHKFTDFQRAPSQTGPLSPPGEQASRLMIPPPGQPYSSDARLPLQRQDRFYSNCGRASGPAEHRIPNMPPLDSD
ncbi:LOW QUALITY PROTEIN: uncharacterized protein ACOB7L_006258, partial [Callospermophilus lateralis]